MGIYIAISGAMFFAASTLSLIFVYLNYKRKAEQLGVDLQKKIADLELGQDDMLIKKTEAETRLSSLREQLGRLENDSSQLRNEKSQAVDDKHKYQRESELVSQRIDMITKEMENWKKTKEEHEKITKASILEMGSKLSSKLLDDHKREAESSKLENEQIVKKTADDLHKQFKSVFDSMSTLHEKVNKSNDTVEIFNRSLLSPSGAGSLSEITLANIFKNSGLIEGQDYKMQYSVENDEGRGLRPDAVVFLPGDNVMVIDSKASKFFVEMEKAENDQQQKEFSEGLKRSMNQHIKDLVSRDYRNAIEKSLGDVQATVLMFLPTETALEKLYAIDSKFRDRAWRERILPVGPTGLVNMLLQSNMQIAKVKQEENAQVIINQVKDLLGSVAKLHELAGAMGRGLKGALDKYDKFAASFNRTFLSKAKKIEALGANVPKMKEVGKLEIYSAVKQIDYKEAEVNDNESAVKELALEE